MLDFLMTNWQWIIGVIIIIIAAIITLIKFDKKTRDEQIHQVKEWLLYAVMEAEKELGSGTGALKLRFVYDMFITKFPLLVALIPFSTFSSFVDEALDKFKKLLATTPELQAYVANQGALEEMKEAVAEIADQNKEEV